MNYARAPLLRCSVTFLSVNDKRQVPPGLKELLIEDMLTFVLYNISVREKYLDKNTTHSNSIDNSFLGKLHCFTTNNNKTSTY